MTLRIGGGVRSRNDEKSKERTNMEDLGKYEMLLPA